MDGISIGLGWVGLGWLNDYDSPFFCGSFIDSDGGELRVGCAFASGGLHIALSYRGAVMNPNS